MMSDDDDDYYIGAGWDYGGKTGEEKLASFKITRRRVNWDNEDERTGFFHELFRLSIGWVRCLPDLRDYFQRDQLDWLLEKLVSLNGERDYDALIRFVIRTGYRDQPELGEDGRASPRRTTPIHRLAKRGMLDEFLFELYRYDVNYADEDGYTHFHAACQFGCEEIAQRFIEEGHDPNCVDRSTGDTPLLLHLANINARPVILRLLLENGADPNAANAEGTTPLHVIATRYGYHRDVECLVDMFFRINEESRRIVLIDAKDSRNRSPLQRAVDRLEGEVVDALLARGADLDGFVFPSEAHYDEFLGSNDVRLGRGRKLLYASAMMHIAERLQAAGYELDQSETTTIMKMFLKYGFNDKSSSSASTSFANNHHPMDIAAENDRRALRRARTMAIRPKLTLYDMILLLRDGLEPAEPLVLRDYYKFGLRNEMWYGCAKEAAVTRMCDRMARRLFLKWALEPFTKVTRNRLPLLCCEMILDNLNNEDLCNVCVAAQGLV